MEVQEILDLKKRVEAYNQDLRVQQALYQKDLADLAERGFTPDTLAARIMELEGEISSLEVDLAPKIRFIEEALRS